MEFFAPDKNEGSRHPIGFDLWATQSLLWENKNPSGVLALEWAWPPTFPACPVCHSWNSFNQPDSPRLCYDRSVFFDFSGASLFCPKNLNFNNLCKKFLLKLFWFELRIYSWSRSKFGYYVAMFNGEGTLQGHVVYGSALLQQLEPESLQEWEWNSLSSLPMRQPLIPILKETASLSGHWG